MPHVGAASSRARKITVLLMSAWVFAGAAADAQAAFELGDIRPYMESAIKRTLGSSVAKQFTTDNCAAAGARGWTCLWNHPDRGASAEIGGSATVKAIKVRGRCKVKVSGEFRDLDSGRSGKLRYTTSGRSRFCR
ncbi:hypothetical protein C8N24_0736 [Solirubrobacter pauli]|uniref:Uncharacterized protein n=1 Tax=Solirubrobacter pauli TaxID=166793 RepID=A0A660LDV7_9ACTN|nr:hypothetical protein [Solirubrobacter pauli]RKQ90921.1 hypothetical protein C8N24_0736 [Solirubrobacter pauli]